MLFTSVIKKYKYVVKAKLAKPPFEDMYSRGCPTDRAAQVPLVLFPTAGSEGLGISGKAPTTSLPPPQHLQDKVSTLLASVTFYCMKNKCRTVRGKGKVFVEIKNMKMPPALL